MKKKVKTIQIRSLIFLILLVAIIPAFSNTMLRNNKTNSSSNNFYEAINVKGSDWWNLSATPIFIDGNAVGVGAHNWTWAESQDWCNGLGTWGAPYIIENVTINCNKTDYGITIRDSTAYFRIQNCTIFNSDLDYGDAAIRLLYLSKGTIYNNTLSKGRGIYTLQADNISISENIINDNLGAGIYASSSDDIKIIDNTFKNNSYHAIRTSGGNYHYIIGNTIEDSHGSGVYTNGDFMNITGNTMFNNTRGITIEHSEGNYVEGNHLNNNEIGIRLLGVTESNFTNNEINNNTRFGIYFDSWCYDNNFTENSMMNCGVEIQRDTFDAMISYTPIDSSNTVNTRPIYYYINETGFIADEFNNAGQVILINCNDSIVSNANASYSSTGISLYYCKNVTITSSDVSNNIYYGITIDYGEHNKIMYSTVNNNGDGDAYGIEIYKSPHSYLLNNTINNSFRSGIRITLCNHSSIINNTAKYNGRHAGDGIEVYYSDSCEVIGNIANDNDEFGMNIQGNYCNITSNVANGNEYGIYIYSEHNNISGNIANRNLEKGFYIWADYNYFTQNIANLNGEDGFYFQDTKFHTLFNNSADNNDWSGFHFLNCNNITILENYVINHISYGIHVVNGENYTIMNNDLLNNEDGVFLEDCTYILVSNNVMQGYTGVFGWGLNHSKIIENDLDYNTQSGVSIIDGEDNLISDNTMNYCDNALYLGSCRDSTISNNEINMNIERGIWIYQCNNIDILDNTASYNVYGLWVGESTDLYISSNTFNNNSEHGIVFVTSENNEIAGNTINNNTEYAIYLIENSNFNTISNNLMYWNEDCIVEESSSNNDIIDNTCENRPLPDEDGDGAPEIPGYNLLLLTIISMAMIVYVLRKRKR